MAQPKNQDGVWYVKNLDGQGRGENHMTRTDPQKSSTVMTLCKIELIAHTATDYAPAQVCTGCTEALAATKLPAKAIEGEG